MTSTVFGILLATLLLLAIWKKLHLRTEQLQFKYKLYKLRDQLRLDAIEGKIDSSHWLFDYYDRTLSKLIANSYELTLLSIVLMGEAHRKDVKMQNFKKDLRYQAGKHKYYKELDEEITKCAAVYVFEQHKVSLQAIIIPVVTPILKFAGWYRDVRKLIQDLTVFPEISDSQGRFA